MATKKELVEENTELKRDIMKLIEDREWIMSQLREGLRILKG